MLCSVSLVLKEREPQAYCLGSVHVAFFPGHLPGAHHAAAPENLFLTASPSGPPLASPTPLAAKPPKATQVYSRLSAGFTQLPCFTLSPLSLSPISLFNF